MMRSIYMVAAAWALAGCRADSGPNDYASQEIFYDASLPIDATPLGDGEQRLGIGAFYEGPFTDVTPIDNMTVHFYVYENTFSASVEPDDKVEGSVSDRLRHAGGPWWGGGVHWDNALDISQYRTLHISLKSSDASYAGLQLGMNNADESQGAVTLSDYGFAPDGEWHELIIPTADYAAAGVDLEQVGAPLVFLGGAGEQGESVLVDGVYFSTEE